MSHKESYEQRAFEANYFPVLRVACTYCGAKVGEVCRGVRPRKGKPAIGSVASTPHSQRMKAFYQKVR